MKKTVIIMAVIILSFLLVNKTDAALEYSEDVYSDSEFQEVKELSEEFSKQFSNFPEGEINFGYKMYAMDPGVFSNLITSGIPLLQLTMEEWIGCDRPYAWILPIGEINYCDLQYINDEWVIGFTVNHYDDIIAGLPKGCEWAPGIVNFEVVQKTMRQIEERGEILTGEQLVFTTGIAETVFFAFRTETDTYLIAFPWRPDLTGLESGVCYTAQEAKNILDKTYPVIYADEQSEMKMLSGGGAVSAYKYSDFENVSEWVSKDIRQEGSVDQTIQNIDEKNENKSEKIKPTDDPDWKEYENEGIRFRAPEAFEVNCLPGRAVIRLSDISRSEVSIYVYHEDQREMYEWLGFPVYEDSDKAAEAFFKANIRESNIAEHFEFDLNGIAFHAYYVNDLTYFNRTGDPDEKPKDMDLLYFTFTNQELYGYIEAWILEDDLINNGPELLRMLCSFQS